MKAVLILFAILAGFILARLGLPASFLTGPLLVAAIFAVTNRPVIRFPLFIYRLAQSVIGVMLSFTITAKSLQTIVTNWAPIATLVITMLVLTTVIGMGLRRFANLQPGTALLGALPGGAGEMIAMSDSLGADVRLVTVMQYGRLLAILATISVVGHFAGRTGRKRTTPSRRRPALSRGTAQLLGLDRYRADWGPCRSSLSNSGRHHANTGGARSPRRDPGNTSRPLAAGGSRRRLSGSGLANRRKF